MKNFIIPENVGGKPVFAMSLFPKSHCVYFLHLGAAVVYVGKSRNLLNRISSHTDKEFDAFSFTECASESDAMALEFMEITRLNPILNKAGGHSIAAGYLSKVPAKKHYGIGKRALDKRVKDGDLSSISYGGVIYYGIGAA
jgi:hypothetical protein